MTANNAVPSETFVPIVNQGFLYINGLGISNDATTPNNIINVAIGQCRDSTNTFDIFLNSSLSANITVSGINGLDTGAVAASKVYAVVLVNDPVSGQPDGLMFTLTPSQPVMPFGYLAWRVIGYAVTDASSHILKGQWTAGGTGSRKFAYESRQATAITAGAATSYTAVDLSTLVPSGIVQMPVSIAYALTPNAAGNALNLQGVNRASAGSDATITGQVAAVVNSGNVEIIAELNAGASNKPEINYKVSSASDAVALSVAGYSLSI